MALAWTVCLRGLQDRRRPWVASVMVCSANIARNLRVVDGLHLGIAGSALGTVISQCGMAAALVLVVTRRARRLRALRIPETHTRPERMDPASQHAQRVLLAGARQPRGSFAESGIN